MHDALDEEAMLACMGNTHIIFTTLFMRKMCRPTIQDTLETMDPRVRGRLERMNQAELNALCKKVAQTVETTVNRKKTEKIRKRKFGGKRTERHLPARTVAGACGDLVECVFRPE
jgi:hypothetical protein